MIGGSSLTERGALFPAELPVYFSRVRPGPDTAHLVTWWWMSKWNLPPGQESAQEVLSFPASNLVFEPEGVRYWGPTTRRSTRILSGRGWVLGALLKPAAVPLFTDHPAEVRDEFLVVNAPEILATVRGNAPDLTASVTHVERWLAAQTGPVSHEARLANRLAEIAIRDSAITSVADLAQALDVSTRTVNRLTAKYVGLSPYTMIRRRRLQEAVAWTREHPQDALADIAAQFGFVDQAHLSHEARTLLGFTLTDYRSRAAHPR